MAYANHTGPLVGLDVEERLYFGIGSGPLELYEDLLDTLEDVDVRGLKQRTLLHLGVKLGKVDWVEGLLSKGADPCLGDGGHVTAVQLAEEMSRVCPEDNDRVEIQRLIRLVHRRDNALNRRRGLHRGDVAGAPLNGFSQQMAELSSLKDSINQLKEEMNAFCCRVAESVDEVKRALSDRDVLLGCIETAVTSSAEVLRELKECMGESLGAVGLTIATPSRAEDARRDCIDSLLGMSTILNWNGNKMSRVRKLYEKLYDNSDVTSCVLKFLKGRSQLEILIDCDSKNIEEMKPKLKDHDGVESNGDEWITFADFSEMKIYIGGKMDELRSEKAVIGSLVWSLSQMCLLLVFGNGGWAYEEGDVIHEQEFRRALREAEEKMESGFALDGYLKWALDCETQLGKEIYFGSAVPGIIARDGSKEGTSILQKQVPLLLDFFMSHVMSTLQRNSTV